MRHEIARNTIVGIEEQDFHGNSQERQTLTENANQQTELSVAVNNEDRPMPLCYRGVYHDVSQTDLRIVRRVKRMREPASTVQGRREAARYQRISLV